VDDRCSLEDRQGCEELGDEDAHEVRGETAKLILLDELVEVDGEEFKDEAQVSAVDKVVGEANKVVGVVGVVLLVERLEDLHLNEALIKVGGLILDHLHSIFLAGLRIGTGRSQRSRQGRRGGGGGGGGGGGRGGGGTAGGGWLDDTPHHLAKGTRAQHINHPVLRTLCVAERLVHVQNIITTRIVVTTIQDSLRGLREAPPRVEGRKVAESSVRRLVRSKQ
jgi:hypothetical protein